MPDAALPPVPPAPAAAGAVPSSPSASPSPPAPAIGVDAETGSAARAVGAEPPAIEVTNLGKSFGRKQVLRGLSFTIPAGVVAGFLGTNGAGKTTTLRIMLDLLQPHAGSTRLLGQLMPGARTRVMASIGAMVERPCYIDSLSGEANLSWFGNLSHRISRQRVREVLDMVGLVEAAGRPFGEYSTGMKQRLGVAAAIMHRPRLILLDEPTSGMDPQGRYQMRQVFLNIRQEGTTILLSSHLIDEVQRLCDYVVILDKGVTARQGYVADILGQDRERLRIRLVGNDGERAVSVIRRLPGVLGVETEAGAILVTAESGRAPAINRALVEAGFDLAALIPEQTSLEQAFIDLTSDDEAATR